MTTLRLSIRACSLSNFMQKAVRCITVLSQLAWNSALGSFLAQTSSGHHWVSRCSRIWIGVVLRYAVLICFNCEYYCSSSALRMFMVAPRRKPFWMNHDSRFSSHSSSILFGVCVAVVAWTAGSYDAGSVSWVQLRLVRWVNLMLPMISARSPYSSPVTVSRLLLWELWQWWLSNLATQLGVVVGIASVLHRGQCVLVSISYILEFKFLKGFLSFESSLN